MKRLFIALVLVASFGCATLKPNPTQTEIQKTHDLALRMAQSIELAMGVTDSVLDVLEVQNAAGTVSTATLRLIAGKAKTFAQAADKALQALPKLVDQPSLKNTITLVEEALQPLIRHLDASSQDSLRALGLALHVAIDWLDNYLGGHMLEAA